MKLSSALLELQLVVDVDVDTLSGPSASSLVDRLTPVVRQLSALRDACVARAVACNQHVVSGATSGSAWVAEKLDVSESSARQTLAVQSSLSSLPEVAGAVLSGSLSLEKAAVVVRGSGGDEALASSLLTTASSSSVEGLKRVVQEHAARESSVEKRKRLRNAQFLSLGRDDDNMVLGRFRLLPEVAAHWMSAWSKVREKAVRGNEDLEEPLPRSVAEAEAFAGFLTQGGGTKTVTTINYHVDHTVFARGFVADGERCEIAGVGPVPLSVIEEALPHSPIRLLLTQQNKLLWYSEERRSAKKSGAVPDYIKRAVKARAYDCCEVEGCLASADEVDHLQPRCQQGSDDVENLGAKCVAHHDLKTMSEASWTKTKIFGKKHRERKERQQRILQQERLKQQVLQGTGTVGELFPDSG
jgi:hypothetical protein